MSTARVAAQLWYWQRASAMVLAICVAIHLVTLIYAVQGGLTAEEILARTRGNAMAALFYGVFVVVAAVHAPIGLARIAEEWLGWRTHLSLAVATVVGLGLVIGGGRAVYAVFAG
ncbi:MAG TPA: succinate dehydrogenase [Casimicrobiaceae bacterium]|nr:succinate dehydrogenase [Casimicrobiaceae bacterium]